MSMTSPSREPIRVLIVDDEQEYLASLSRALGRRGFAVTAVDNGAAAIEIHARSAFDVIVVDLRMPVLDGIATLTAIRGRDLRTPVLLLSGQADLASAATALRHGVTDCLLKPCEVEDLAVALEDAAEHHRAATALASSQDAGRPPFVKS